MKDNYTCAFVTMEKQDNRPKNSVGSSRIRAKWLYDRWAGAEEYHIGKKYDVMVFQKVYWEEMLKTFEGIKILDLCDPDWLEGKDVMRYAAMCDAVVTSTQPLADYVSKYVDTKTVCIPDRVALDEHNPRGHHTGTAKSVVWFGYAQTAHYLEPVFKYLNIHSLNLTAIANKGVKEPLGYEQEFRSIIYNYPSIHEEIVKHDFAVLPVTKDVDLRGKYKSNNKSLTCWALGLPVAQFPEDLERFMDADERNAEVENRQIEVREKWDVMQSVEEYKKLIDDIKKEKV